ncbi:MAG: metallophosphoesterase [Thermoanaerobaculia bacterium]
MPNRIVLFALAMAALSCVSATPAPIPTPTPAPPARAEEPAEPWAFAVSGDSRDCGDLIMPKIAAAVLAETGPANSFYWHLGDFRRMYDIDCDILKRTHPTFDCKTRSWDSLGSDEMAEYSRTAYDDFIQYQLEPFGAFPVLLGIGNHELYGRSRDEFRRVFRPWLAQKMLHTQRLADAARKLPVDVGGTWYHFVMRGVEFINLDNGDESMFSHRQLVWLGRVLAEAVKDPAIRSIVVGMHEALPYSTSRGHAMDSSCQGLCSGQQVYDMLFRAQGLSGPVEKRKKVYVLASHDHTFKTDVYNTPEHNGQVLPGWIVGTAGAVQSGDPIAYGYLRMEVALDGTVTPRFRPVSRTSPPLGSGSGAESLEQFCFEANKRIQAEEAFKGDCVCGATRPAE